MHRQFQDLLPDAEGSSQWVVAVFLDVRGFSGFAGSAESVQAALFLKKMYARILTKYFPEPEFLKPTGDGLMIIYHHSEQNLPDRAKAIVAAALELVEDFASIVQNEPMVNFPVPSLLGIGIARGAATRLATGEICLDYSGRPLNLAARLMDFARPSGVVLDETFNLGLLGDLEKRFESCDVYIRGIAEASTRAVHYLPELTVISDSARRPLLAYEWRTETVFDCTFAKLQESTQQRVRFVLEGVPAFPSSLEVRVEFPRPLPSGRRSSTAVSGTKVPVKFEEDGGQPVAWVELGATCDVMRERGVKAQWPVTVTVEYQVLPATV